MVDYRSDGNIAFLEINNPPVNALSQHVRAGLQDGVQKANNDKKIQAIIVTGKGRTFPSGADIREFSKPLKGPWLSEVGHELETSTKPVICAIHGTCLGGGLEVALFSHYRIADKKSIVGFPEVNIGILPGAEGTVRLPRVAGVAVAIEMITSGRHVSAQEAFKYGVLDKVAEGDLLEEAKALAASVIGKPLHPRRLSQRSVRRTGNMDAVFEGALKEIKKKYKGLIAPLICVKSIRFATQLPYEEAVIKERDCFRELVSGAQARALQYAFFSDRSAPKWSLPGGANISNTKPVPVHSVGVVGGGTMGSGITICLIRVGIPVILVERDAKMLKKTMDTIIAILIDSVKRKKMTPLQKNDCQKILRGALSLEQLSKVDLVIEAVYENLTLKKDIFSKLDKICKPETILCSNTSTLDIDKIASATSRPDKVVGTHFFAPAHIMKLLENVYGSKTSPSTVATVMQLGKTIGKISVLVRTCTGFVANRMNKIGTEGMFLLEEGALPQEVDQVMEDFGMAMGTFKVIDLSGNDVGWRVRQEEAKEKGIKLTLETRFNSGERYCSLSDRLYEMGRHGLKTGKGWYCYKEPFARTAYPDPDVLDMILTHCQSLGIERRNIPPQEITERCLYASINEGFRILEEGVAEKPEDIDVIWLYGFSFPRYRGGPMFYASQVGLKTVYERICYYYSHFPYSSHWMPSNLLRKLAAHSTEIPMNQWTKFCESQL